MANTVTIQITSVNRAGPGIAAAIAQIHQLTVAVHQSGDATTQTDNIFGRLGSTVSSVAGKVLVGVRTVTAFASAAYAAAAASIMFAKALATIAANLGTAIARLLPLAAFLPSLIGSFFLIKTTASLMGEGFTKAFQPIMNHFRNAKGEASDFTKRLQDIAGIGLKPLTAEFNRLNIPAIQRGMEGVAYQLNGIVYHTLRWLNTTQGQSLIAKITDGTKKAFEDLTPHVLRLVYAFGGLAEKAGDKAILGLGDVIGRILDKISTWAEQHDLDDINAALKDLSGYGARLQNLFGVVRDIGKWMGENEGKIKAFSDTIAAAAITIGIATGNIPAILAGTATIIVNHLDFIKEQFGGFANELFHIFDGSTMPTEVMDALREISDDIGPAVAEALDTIMEAVRENKGSFEKLGRYLADVIIPLLGYVLIDTIVFVGKAIKNCIDVIGFLVEAFDFLYTEGRAAIINLVLSVVNSFDKIVQGAAKAFSWVPGLGPKLDQAAREVHDFVNEVNNYLKNIRDEDVYVRTHFVGGQGQSRGGEYRTGGVVSAAAATGGVRGGLVKVGEDGEEFVRTPQGSMVYPHSNTSLMQEMGGKSGGATAVELRITGSGALYELLMQAQRTGDLQILSTAIV